MGGMRTEGVMWHFHNSHAYSCTLMNHFFGQTRDDSYPPGEVCSYYLHEEAHDIGQYAVDGGNRAAARFCGYMGTF